MKRLVILLIFPVVLWSCGGETDKKVNNAVKTCLSDALTECDMDLDEMVAAFDDYYLEKGWINDKTASSYLGLIENLNNGEITVRPNYTEVYKTPTSELLFDEIDVCVQKNEDMHAATLSDDAHSHKIFKFFEVLRSPDSDMDMIMTSIREMLADAEDDDNVSKAIVILITTDL